VAVLIAKGQVTQLKYNWRVFRPDWWKAPKGQPQAKGTVSNYDQGEFINKRKVQQRGKFV